MIRPVEAESNRPRYKLGLYAFVSAKSDVDSMMNHSSEANGHSASRTDMPADIRILTTLNEEDLDGVHCLVVDIRHNARQILHDCRDAASRHPLIVVADPDQSFANDYPYGTYVSDITTQHELGKTVFWHRVNRAVRSYEQPLTVSDINTPVHGVFKAIADQSSDWIIIKDLKHRFVVAGEHFATTAGKSMEDILGHDDLEIGSADEAVLGNPETGDIGFWAQDDAVTSSGQASVEENPEWLLYTRKARYRRTYRVPLKNPAGQVFALLVCSQDITEQMRNAELLSERTNILEQVTDEKKQAVHNRKVAEDAVAAKSRFLAAASHDLRQPLHAIGLFLDSLEKRVEGRAEYELVQQIKQSCTALGNLFNSCLDISRLDAGVVERNLEDFTAASFLEGLNEEFRQQAREKSLDYRLVVDDSIIHSDQMLLARIVRNLLNNAIQNTDSGYLSIECQNAGSIVEMSIIDTGSGIETQEQELVFEEFHQINSSDARRGRGLGLGLSIVKRLSDLLDIKIKLDSTPGQGSRFILSIPAGELSSEYPAESSPSINLPEELLVLIIEDDQSIRFGMEVLLGSYGCKTLCAEDTEAALQLLKAAPSVPDIIVADYHLSRDKRGTQAISQLRDFLDVRVPAILVTGDTSQDSERDAAVQHIPILYKPVDTDELIATIGKEVRQLH